MEKWQYKKSFVIVWYVLTVFVFIVFFIGPSIWTFIVLIYSVISTVVAHRKYISFKNASTTEMKIKK